jgi:hypothetical protein
MQGADDGTLSKLKAPTTSFRSSCSWLEPRNLALISRSLASHRVLEVASCVEVELEVFVLPVELGNRRP